MIKTIMVGSVSITQPTEVFVAKPMRVLSFGQLALLAKKRRACLEYANVMTARSAPKISRAAHSSMAAAISIKRYMDKMYNRMYRTWETSNETVR